MGPLTIRRDIVKDGDVWVHTGSSIDVERTSIIGSEMVITQLSESGKINKLTGDIPKRFDSLEEAQSVLSQRVL